MGGQGLGPTGQQPTGNSLWKTSEDTNHYGCHFFSGQCMMYYLHLHNFLDRALLNTMPTLRRNRNTRAHTFVMQNLPDTRPLQMETWYLWKIWLKSLKQTQKISIQTSNYYFFQRRPTCSTQIKKHKIHFKWSKHVESVSRFQKETDLPKCHSHNIEVWHTSVSLRKAKT